MKKLRNKLNPAFFILMITTLLLPGLSMAQPSGLHHCIIAATGTGKTTGDIVAMTIFNPSQAEVKAELGPYFIPSDGKYQSYTIKDKIPVTIPAGETIKINLKGFCADITKPPVGETDPFVAFNRWIKIMENNNPQFPPIIININPDTDPVYAAPYLLEALNKIDEKYTGLKNKGLISTPFSGNPEKERESVIQQTFWIYTSGLRETPYIKEDFKKQTYKQLEEKNNINPVTLPKEQKEKIDKGIDDFWDTFEAVGREAKVLKSPEEPKIIASTSKPEVKPCNCSKCEILTPVRIIDNETGKEITKDSVPWMANRLTVVPPVITSNCPGDCEPGTFVKVRATPHYKYYKHSGTLWQPKQLDIDVRDVGYMEFEAEYECTCASKPCGNGTVKRIIHFTEKNNCCDSIRRKNNGLILFPFKGGNAQVRGNSFILQSAECGYQQFDFGFNIEVILCNLSDNQVFSELITLAEVNLSKGNLKEFSSTRSISMGGVSTDPNMARFYGFSFSKKVNEKEIKVFISIDNEKCVFDVSILCNGKLYEFSAPPYLTPAQLTAMAIGLAAPTSVHSWMNAMLILSNLARAEEHGQGQAYLQAYRIYLTKILSQVSVLMNIPEYAQLKPLLVALQIATQECLAKGDFNLLDNVLVKMIPILNAMNK